MSRRDAEFLYEIGTLRHIARTWSQFGEPSFANVAEHSFRVMWIAIILAKREKADVGKVAQLALLHDVSETRTGDQNYLSSQYVKKRDVEALVSIFSKTSLESEAGLLAAEYEARETLEAKIVKDADTLDCDFELEELAARGSSLPEKLKETRSKASGKLHTKSARLLLKELYLTDVHDWHLTGRNKSTEDDWRG